MNNTKQSERTPAPVMGLYDQPMWQSIRDKAMQLQRCEQCQTFHYPPAPVCSTCLSTALHWTHLSGKGTIRSWTIFHKTYLPAYPAPYNVIAVALAEGPTIISNLKGPVPSDNWIGKAVQLRYTTMPDGAVLPTFVLDEGHGNTVADSAGVFTAASAPADHPDSKTAKHSAPHVQIRPEWLGLRSEAALDAERPIIDAHHHLWEFPDKRYLADDLLQDIGSAHNIRATVFVECRTHYKTDGPVPLRPVGEVAFAVGEGQRAVALPSSAHATQRTRTSVCAAVVGYADLSLGKAVKTVLVDLIARGEGRLRSIRNVAVWHADPTVRASSITPPAGLLGDPQFRKGFAELAPLGLSFDAWLIHTQLNDLYELAVSFPDTRIVLNHVGGPLALGPYRGHREAVFQAWRESMRALARCNNVFVKLGGFGMPLFGFDFHERALPPDSITVAAAIEPYVATCIALFGASRCMFESNFPVDKGSFSYDVIWNAYKRVTASADEADKSALFSKTAAQFYGLAEG